LFGTLAVLGGEAAQDVKGNGKDFPCFFKEMLETAGVALSGAPRVVLYNIRRADRWRIARRLLRRNP